MQHLVLVGGGHSHAIALKQFARHPLANLRLTLISDTTHTPYSGMLPGYLAGFYSYEQTHIDLKALAKSAQAEFYLDKAIGLDLQASQVLLSNHPPLSFDYLSLNIGSTPATAQVPGAKDYAIPIKPVAAFLEVWEEILQQCRQLPEQSLTISIVGGGAGGVELALNVHSRLTKILAPQKLTIHLFHNGKQLLPGHNSWVSRRLEKLLENISVQLHLSTTVQEILPKAVICNDGLTVNTDYTFWVTQASAPEWVKSSGLATDPQGFILIKDTLQSLSHPQVFAAGDIATLVNNPRPKAGVFAVRQGKPLFTNLCRIIQGQPLQPYYPQKRYLSLIGTGKKTAIASWASWGWESPLLWLWKDYIDRQFMAQFQPPS